MRRPSTAPSTCSSVACARSSGTTQNIRRSFEPFAGSATASTEAVVIRRSSTSIFGKLVAVMVTMAASLLILVGGFFWFIVRPAVGTSIDRVLEEQARTIASGSPDPEAARRLGARSGLQVRYQGPAGSWSTV